MKVMLQENVQYLKSRTSAYNKMYVIDPDPSYANRNGKHFIDNDEEEKELLLVSEVVENIVKKKYILHWI